MISNYFNFKLLFVKQIQPLMFLFQCTWPHLERNDSKDGLKVAFLADTHLLGIRKGHWFDKLRRYYRLCESTHSYNLKYFNLY